MDRFDALCIDRERVILDGGLATELERRGHHLDDPLWSARLLLKNPEAIAEVHADYAAAGAQVIVTASYQATIQGLMGRGLSWGDSAEILRLTTQLTPPQTLTAASIGPYGAYLANGAEYTGNYDLDRASLTQFHHDRWFILDETTADLFACETIPSYIETLALLDLLAQTPKRRAWFSFSCRDGVHISDGTPLAACGRLLDKVPQVVAVGVNCTAPQWIPSLIATLRASTSKPIIVYPNSGEVWQNGRWAGEPIDFSTQAQAWYKLGATLIGGCCRTTPEDIYALAQTKC